MSAVRNASWRRSSGRRTGGTLSYDSVALTADLLAMAVAAGLTPYLALGVAMRFGPEPVSERLGRVLTGSGPNRIATPRARYGVSPAATAIASRSAVRATES